MQKKDRVPPLPLRINTTPQTCKGYSVVFALGHHSPLRCKYSEKKEVIPLSQIRNAEIYISSAQAAAIVKRTYVWVNQNKGRFSFVRKGKKILRYEITSVIKVATELQQTTPIPMLIESGQKYQEAS